MIRILLFLVLSVSFKISAQDFFRAGELKEKKYLEIVDFEIVKGKIIVPVVIKGETYRFLLDTGAPNIISERLYKKSGSELLTQTPIKDANNNIDTMKVVRLSELNLGNLTFENSTSLVSDLENHDLLKCFEIDGFIGSNLFKNTVVKISLKEKKLYITDNVKNLKPLTKGIKLQLVGGQASPYIKANIKGENNKKATEAVLIDTGMDGLYDISDRVFKIFDAENIFSNRRSALGSGSIGIFGKAEIETRHQITIAEFGIDKSVFKDLSATTTDDNNSRIGLNLLKYGDITIDFKKQKFYFENTSEIQLKAPEKISYILEDSKLIIDFVWDETLKDKIQHGNQVIRIDNLDIKNMEICELLTIKEYTRNKISYELEVLNNENEIVIITLSN